MLVVIGKHGLIARRLAQTAARQGIAAKITSSHPQPGDLPLDLTRADAFDYDQLPRGCRVVMLAAVSAPDECRADPARCRAVNVDGTVQFIQRALERGARVLFASSDTVYGERKAPCDEWSEPRPLGDYAHMKYEVESRFQRTDGFKSMRFSYVFSREDRFTAQLDQCVREGRTADVFAPLDRRVVHIDDVVAAILALFERWHTVDSPWVNVGGDHLVSRIDMARTYQALCAPRLQFSVRDPGEGFYQARPRVIDMESRYLAGLLGRRPRSLEDAMRMEFDVPENGGVLAHDG